MFVAFATFAAFAAFAASAASAASASTADLADPARDEGLVVGGPAAPAGSPQEAAPAAATRGDEVDAPPARVRIEVDLAAEGARDRFAFSDPAAWRVTTPGPDAAPGEVAALELTGPSGYRPPHRSPLAIALLRSPAFTDVVVEADVVQTGREYGHRDLCLFFGFESRERFYYTHLATAPDANAHNVFLVDGAPRRNLLAPREEGVDWGDGVTHRVRLVRTVSDGSIRVFYDDMEHPVLEAVDTTIGAGRVGFGSFDDTGRFSRIVVEGVPVAAPGASPPAEGASARPAGLDQDPFGSG